MKKSIVWLRQDLRLRDNPALHFASQQSDQLAIVYILEEPLSKVQTWWLFQSLQQLSLSLQERGQTLIFRKGNALNILNELIAETGATSLYFNRRYEPQYSQPKLPQIEVFSYNGSLLLEPWEISPQKGSFFRIFTPFWKKALQLIEIPPERPIPKFPSPFNIKSDPIPESDLPDPLFSIWKPGEEGAHQHLKRFTQHSFYYPVHRDFPAKEGTSKLSPYFHFGEVSPQQIWRRIDQPVYRAELGWREFCYHLLHHFPNLPTEPFDERFKHIPWENNQAALHAWQKGETGFPIVDAGMRELKHTGWMHNRVRMITASFLTKDLRIAWQEGEAWFWKHLIDADLANNSANWQWVAGCGADAAPYFRIFNPILQGKKFDPQGEYILKWCPEYKQNPHDLYHPIVDHAQEREKTLQIFSQSIKMNL
ncbi:MAG: deoxyribodipyrimidine photo-lyase [Verrucomicrobia bacterium]|nr:deoxyribodipyrimidine photo-lyase [Verrucomicrobiota bacterium]MBS0646400.1 deoxyribodipyrimidine photo-lyase [Verrucomicrobiota bacterium]